MQLSNSKYLLPRSLGINRPERTLEDSERIETRYGNIREPHVSPETNKNTLTPELSSPTVQQSRGAHPLTPFTTAHLLEAVSKNVKQPQPNTAYKQTKSYIRGQHFLVTTYLHITGATKKGDRADIPESACTFFTSPGHCAS